MENAKGSTNVRNIMQTGKNSLLPPRIPFPSPSSVYSDYNINPTMGSQGMPKPKDFSPYHQRASSESLLTDEQLSWLDDLLNEPDTPVRKGHRRSSSDSFAYVDMAGLSNMDYVSNLHDERTCKNMPLPQLWESQNADSFKVNQFVSLYADPDSYGKPVNRIWEWPLTSAKHSRNPPALTDKKFLLNVGSASTKKGADLVSSTLAEVLDQCESGPPDSKPFLEKDGSHLKMPSKNDSKRAKQQFAQRSRVQKLQYIAELERSVQALQAEGSEVSAEVEFLNQQSLILGMENKTLKQRVQSLAQEQLIKRLEHEVLEREVSRLWALYQQPQPQKSQQQPYQRQSPSAHRRANSKDLDSQFASLSLKQKDGN